MKIRLILMILSSSSPTKVFCAPHTRPFKPNNQSFVIYAPMRIKLQWHYQIQQSSFVTALHHFKCKYLTIFMRASLDCILHTVKLCAYVHIKLICTSFLLSSFIIIRLFCRSRRGSDVKCNRRMLS